MSSLDIWPILIAVAIPPLGGFFIARTFKSSIYTWYKDLKKPSFNPPNWVFAPVWSIIYVCIGYSSYLVWRDGGGFQGEAKLPLAVYAFTIFLNWWWTPIFFYFHKLGLATIESFFMWVMIIATMVTFKGINTTASLLHLPFFFWVSFATFLSYTIWQLNKAKKD